MGAPTAALRDRDVPIASQVDVTVTDMIGGWTVRGFFPANVGGAEMPARSFRIEEGADVNQFELSFGAGRDTPSQTFVQVGPGRFERVTGGDPMTQAWWVLWADVDRRTMAIGAPNGAVGLILDRAATGGMDRVAAARDIMDWMGYSVGEMEIR